MADSETQQEMTSETPATKQKNPKRVDADRGRDDRGRDAGLDVDSETQTTNDFKKDKEYSEEEYSEEVDEAADLLIEGCSNALALWGQLTLKMRQI